MNNLNATQIANFGYWMSEYNRIPHNLQEAGYKAKLAYIENTLLPEFLRKYPKGILTGWSN